MKKGILFFVGVLLLVCLASWKKPFFASSPLETQKVEHDFRAPSSQGAATALLPRQVAEPSSPVKSDEAPRMQQEFFPRAKVISSITLPGKKVGEVLVIKTLETDLKQPFVRVEETYIGEGPTRQMVDQAAMIANQILVRRPKDVLEADFVTILEKAGAIALKKMTSGYLVTFQARPEDPQALDSYMEKVRTLAPATLIEPNYVRKIF